MQVECVCGQYHDVAPTGLILIIYAYQNGELTTTKGRPVCMMEAFTVENIDNIKKRYPKGQLFGRNGA